MITATLHTNHGDIVLELFENQAARTVVNFLTYCQDKHYHDTLFHRVIDGFMIQGGGYSSDFVEKPTRDPVSNESFNKVSNTTGTIAMARTSDPQSATSQFFINVRDNDFLDFKSPKPEAVGYCVFGRVIDGMDVVNTIKGVKTSNQRGHQDVPVEPVIIQATSLNDEAVALLAKAKEILAELAAKKAQASTAD